MRRTPTAVIAAASGLFMVSSLVAATYTYPNITQKNWGDIQVAGDPSPGNSWWQQSAAYVATVPNAIDDEALISFTSGSSKSIVVANDSGGAATYTIGTFTVTHSNNQQFSVNTVAGSKVIFDVSSGNATLTENNSLSNKFLNFKVDIQLNDNLDLNVTGTSSSFTKITGAITSGASLTTGIVKNNNGTVELNALSSYTGTTTVNDGRLRLATDGTLGAGHATVNAGGILDIQTTLTSGGINDLAILSIANDSDPTTGVALAAGINDLVSGLVLGGVAQTMAGTYGSSSSGATFNTFDEYFQGTGVITLVPEPASLSLLALAPLALGRRRKQAV